MILGAVYAVISAATFAFNNASLRRGVISSTVFQALAITVPMGVPLFFLAALVTGQLSKILEFNSISLVCLSAAGIFHFVWGRYCGYRAIKAMGSNLAAPVQSANLVIALTLAIVLLDETMTALKILGLGLIIIGNVIAIPSKKQRDQLKTRVQPNQDKSERDSPSSIIRESGNSAATQTPEFKPNLTEGYTWALLSATGYGISPVLVRQGMDGMTGSALAAGFISYLAAGLFFCLFLIPRGRIQHVISMDRRAIPWFTYSGFFGFLAQMFRYLALSVAPVTVVAPIQRITGIFRIIFSSLLNPGHEVMNFRLIFGTMVSIAGAIALAMSVDLVTDWINLPTDLLNWQWP
jgi:drug/metabolite transporter (DMT)-like permease